MNTDRLRRIFALAGAGLVALALTPEVSGAEDEAPEPEVAVKVAPLTRATVRAYVTVYGTVEPEPASEGRSAAAVTLAAPAGGLLAEVTAVEGAKVARGARLFRFDSRVADAAVEKARTAVDFAGKVLARQRKLSEIDGTSQKNVLEAEQQVASAEQDLKSAEAARALLDVISPIDGVLTRVRVRAGEAVEAGVPLATIVDPGRLVAAAAVPVREAGMLKPGQKARVSAAAGGEPVAGTLAYIAQDAVPGADTVALRIALAPGAGLRPGQFATARIVADERPDRLVVPYASLYTDHDGKSAISLVVDGKAKRVDVVRGLRDGDLVEISGDGLEPGMTAVTVGSYALPDGTKVRVDVAPSKEARP